MNNFKFFACLAVAAGVTYMIRMVPFVLIKKKIKNRFVLSFLYYIPYAVLGVMTIPSIFYSTSYALSAVIGFAAAVVLAYREKSLLAVASVSCAVVFAAEFVIKLVA